MGLAVEDTVSLAVSVRDSEGVRVGSVRLSLRLSVCDSVDESDSVTLVVRDRLKDTVEEGSVSVTDGLTV